MTGSEEQNGLSEADHTQSQQHPTEANELPKKHPPGHRNKNYAHSNEHEHRTAEQFYWRWANVINALIAIFTSAAACFAYKAYTEAQSQAITAEKSLVALTRAWLDANILQNDKSLRWDIQQLPQVMPTVRVTNHGSSPATNSRVFTTIVFGSNNIDELSARAVTHCKDVEKRSKLQSFMVSGDDRIDIPDIATSFDQQEAADFIAKNSSLTNPLTRVAPIPQAYVAVVCIIYHITGDTEWRYTMRAYLIRKGDNHIAKAGETSGIAAGVEVPGNLLGFGPIADDVK